MGLRSDLNNLLILTLGSNHVYFQPPPSVKMAYPCIVYSLSGDDAKFADDSLYSVTKKYSVTVIDRDPDSSIPDRVRKLPLCSFDRHYVADNLYHYSFSIYY